MNSSFRALTIRRLFGTDTYALCVTLSTYHCLLLTLQCLPAVLLSISHYCLSGALCFYPCFCTLDFSKRSFADANDASKSTVNQVRLHSGDWLQ